MKRLRSLRGLLLAAAAVMTLSSFDVAEYDYIRVAAPFPMPAIPVYNFPHRDFTITDYGAKKSGTATDEACATANTEAFRRAMQACSEAGGGRVVVPDGEWPCGPIHFKSNCELHLSDGATVRFSSDPARFLPAVEVSWEGMECMNYSPMVYAYRCENIAITGGGKLTPDMATWRTWFSRPKPHMDALARLYDWAYQGLPVAQRNMAEGQNHLRPHMIHFNQCRNIMLDGFKIRNSPFWTIHMYRCEGGIVRNLDVYAHGHNNDGIDISDCKDVRIAHCDVNSADDGICLKSHNRDACNDRVSIAHCRIISSASAIKFGTESGGGFKNVTIDDIRVKDPYRSAIAIESVDGAAIENIWVSNIHAVNTGNAIFIRLGHRSGEASGYVRNVSIRNLYAEIPFGRPDIDYDLRGPALPFFHNPFPASISGIPGHDIENVTLENIEIVYPGRASKGMAYISLSRLADVPENVDGYPEFSMFEELPAWGFYVRHVSGLTLKGITLRLREDDYRPAFVFDRVSRLNLSDIVLPEDKQAGQVVLRQTGLQRKEGVPERWIFSIDN